MSEFRDTWTLTLSKERKVGRVIKTRPGIPKDYSNYYIQWTYEKTKNAFKTSLNQPINFLIEELCELIEIDNENLYDFVGNFYLERETIDLKSIRWEIIDKKMFSRLNQTFIITITPNENEYEYLNAFDEILQCQENPTIQLKKSCEYKKIKPNEEFENNIINSYDQLASYLSVNKKCEENKLSLIFRNFKSFSQNSSQQLKIDSEKILILKFLDSRSYINFILLYETLEIKSREIYLVFSFDIKDNLNINDIFAISKLLPANDVEKINLHLKIKCNVLSTDTILPDYSKYSKKHNINVISLEIEDQLLGFCKDFILNKFLSDIYLIFNISSLKSFYLKNTKFTFPINVYYLLYFLALTNNSLRKIHLVDNKVEYEDFHIKDYFYITENEGIHINLNNEKICLPYLEEFVIVNTKLLTICDLSKCSLIFANKNLQFDSSSLLISEKQLIPIDKFTKNGELSHLKINSNIEKSFFKGSKFVMSDLSQLTVNNIHIHKNDEISFNLFGSVIKNSDLHQIRKLNFSKCHATDTYWLNNILENFSISKLRSLKLREIFYITYLDTFFYRNSKKTEENEELFYINELYVKDSYIDLEKFEIDSLKKLFINKLRINLSNIFEINSDDSLTYIKKTIQLLGSLLSYAQIQNIIFENEALQILQNFSMKLEVKQTNLNNLILRDIKCVEPLINILMKLNLYPQKICFLNISSAIFSEKIPENKIQFDDIYIDVKSINSQFFNQPNISDIISYFNCYIDKKDQEIKNQLSNVEKNFSSFDILEELKNKMINSNRKLNILFKNSHEILLFKVIYSVYKELHRKNSKLKEIIKSLLQDGSTTNSYKELFNLDIIKDFFIFDKQNLIKLKHRRDTKTPELSDFNFIKLK